MATGQPIDLGLVHEVRAAVRVQQCRVDRQLAVVKIQKDGTEGSYADTPRDQDVLVAWIADHKIPIRLAHTDRRTNRQLSEGALEAAASFGGERAQRRRTAPFATIATTLGKAARAASGTGTHACVVGRPAK